MIYELEEKLTKDFMIDYILNFAETDEPISEYSYEELRDLYLDILHNKDN